MTTPLSYYEIEEQLGKGTYGVVYRASVCRPEKTSDHPADAAPDGGGRDNVDDDGGETRKDNKTTAAAGPRGKKRFVAMKKHAFVDRIDDSDFIACLSEFSILSYLVDDANIVPIRNVVVLDQGIYTVMDLAQGTLYDYMERDSEVWNVTLIREVAAALVSILARAQRDLNLVHGDVKPHNILLRRRQATTATTAASRSKAGGGGDDKSVGINEKTSEISEKWPSSADVWLADWGSCRPLSVLMHEPAELCTLWYRPPELLLGPRRDGTPGYLGAIDVWGIGCSLMEMMEHLFPCQIEAPTRDSAWGQLMWTFQGLGTPSAETWPDIVNYQNYSRLWPQWPSEKSRIRAWMEHWTSASLQHAEQLSLLKDFVLACLTFSPTDRPTPVALLNHPFIRDHVVVTMRGAPTPRLPKHLALPQPFPLKDTRGRFGPLRHLTLNQLYRVSRTARHSLFTWTVAALMWSELPRDLEACSALPVVATTTRGNMEEKSGDSMDCRTTTSLSAPSSSSSSMSSHSSRSPKSDGAEVTEEGLFIKDEASSELILACACLTIAAMLWMPRQYNVFYQRVVRKALKAYFIRDDDADGGAGEQKNGRQPQHVLKSTSLQAVVKQVLAALWPKLYDVSTRAVGVGDRLFPLLHNIPRAGKAPAATTFEKRWVKTVCDSPELFVDRTYSAQLVPAST